MNSVVSERSKNEVFGGQGKSPGAALTPRRFFFFFFWVGFPAGLLLTIMPSCHVFGRFLFFFFHHATGWWGRAFALHHLGISPPDGMHDGMMAP